MVFTICAPGVQEVSNAFCKKILLEMTTSIQYVHVEMTAAAGLERNDRRNGCKTSLLSLPHCCRASSDSNEILYYILISM